MQIGGSAGSYGGASGAGLALLLIRLLRAPVKAQQVYRRWGGQQLQAYRGGDFESRQAYRHLSWLYRTLRQGTSFKERNSREAQICASASDLYQVVHSKIRKSGCTSS